MGYPLTHSFTFAEKKLEEVNNNFDEMTRLWEENAAVIFEVCMIR